MCGIVGLISNSKNGFLTAEVDAFKDMLFVDTLRGFDSTGVFSVDKYTNVNIAKEATHGLRFLFTEEFKDFKADLYRRGKMAIGHNRAATRGNVTDENAHPFWVDDKIILVQNGTFKGEHKHIKDTEVDSEAIAHLLAEEPDVEKALKKVNAAYALVWYNTQTNMLSLIRNTERPLFIGERKHGGLVFASEKETILWACSRNKIELDSEPYLLKEFTLLQYELDDNEIKEHVTALDCRYEWPKSNRTHRYPGYSDDMDEWENWYENSYSHNREANNDTTVLCLPQKEVSEANLNAIIHQPGDLIRREQEEFRYLDKDMLLRDMELFDKTIPIDRELCVELEDYSKANNHEDCKAWVVWGVPVLPFELHFEGPGPRITWFVYGKSEKEMLSYIRENFYVAIRGAITQHCFHHKNELMYAMTCYGGRPKAFEVVTQAQ